MRSSECPFISWSYLALTPGQLIVARAVQGIGGAMLGYSATAAAVVLALASAAASALIIEGKGSTERTEPETAPA